jgi:hypothetical protein
VGGRNLRCSLRFVGLQRNTALCERTEKSIDQCCGFVWAYTFYHNQKDDERSDCGMHDGHEENQGKLLEKSTVAGKVETSETVMMAHDKEDITRLVFVHDREQHNDGSRNGCECRCQNGWAHLDKGVFCAFRSGMLALVVAIAVAEVNHCQ